MKTTQQEFYANILRIVQILPSGSVTTYGELAKAAGRPNGARQIGRALYQLRSNDPNLFVPWWRVVNAAGKISVSDVALQQKLLQKEGVEFSQPGCIKDFDNVRFPVDLLHIDNEHHLKP